MAEYIDRQAALDAYKEEQQRNGPWRFETLIKSIPAADVAPVVRSQWIDTGEKDEDGNVWFVCKECGHKDLHAPLMEVPHCWYCGARMDGTEVTDERSE